MAFLASRGLIGSVAALGGLAYGVYESVFSVPGGHQGVMFSRINGVTDQVISEGIHFRVPWFQYPYIFSLRAKPYQMSSPTGTKDLQMVNISLRVLYRPDENNLPKILRNLGQDYDRRVLPSIANEVLKAVVAKFNASQLITQRESVSNMIRDALTDRADDFWIKLEDVSITDMSFSEEYAAAVERKQVAQQDAQRAALVVEQAKQEARQKVVEAEGEARSAQLIGQAIAENPGFLNLRKLDAARQISHAIAASQNRVYLDSDSLLLNVDDHSVDIETLKPSKKK